MQLGQYQVSEEELQGVWGLLALIATPQAEAAQKFLQTCMAHEEATAQALSQVQELLQQVEAKHADLKPREDALKEAEKRAQDLIEQATKTKADYENKRAQIKAIM